MEFAYHSRIMGPRHPPAGQTAQQLPSKTSLNESESDVLYLDEIRLDI